MDNTAVKGLRTVIQKLSLETRETTNTR